MITSDGKPAVISWWYGEHWKELGLINDRNKENYCRSRGYDFIARHDKPDLPDSVYISWWKVRVIIEDCGRLDNGISMLCDADTLITDYSVKFPRLIDDWYTFALPATFEWGAIIYRRNATALKWFEQLWYMRNEHLFGEDIVFRMLWLRNEELGRITKLVHPKKICASIGMSNYSYSPDDFMMHAMGHDPHVAAGIFNKYLEEINIFIK